MRTIMLHRQAKARKHKQALRKDLRGAVLDKADRRFYDAIAKHLGDMPVGNLWFCGGDPPDRQTGLCFRQACKRFSSEG